MSDAPAGEMTATIGGYLDRLAAKSASPAAGGAAALGGAVGCALARMVAAYSVGRHADGSAHRAVERSAVSLERADLMLRRLVDEDAAAYAEFVAARRAAKSDPGRAGAYQEAVLLAASVPLEIVAVSGMALAEMAALAPLANPNLLCDLGAAAALVQAAAVAASYMVKANAPEISDAARRTRLLEDLTAMLEHAQLRAASVAATRATSEPHTQVGGGR